MESKVTKVRGVTSTPRDGTKKRKSTRLAKKGGKKKF